MRVGRDLDERFEWHLCEIVGRFCETPTLPSDADGLKQKVQGAQVLAGFIEAAAAE